MGQSESASPEPPHLPTIYYGTAQPPNRPGCTVSIYKHNQYFLQQNTFTTQSSFEFEAQCSIYTLFTKQEKHFQKIFRLEILHPFACRTSYQIITLSNYYSFTLRKLIDRKSISKTLFSQAELWYVLRSITEAGAFLEKRSLIIGDIRPQNIFLSYEHNIRVGILQILPQMKNSCFYRSFMGFRQGCLFSPEQLVQLKQGRQNPEYNPYKSEVFSMGLTVLECITRLDSAVNFYQYSTFSINLNKLRNVLEDVLYGMSPLFSEIMKWVLSPQERHRPDFRELVRWLDQRKQYIQDTYVLSIDEKEPSTSLAATTEPEPKKKKSLRKIY